MSMGYAAGEHKNDFASSKIYNFGKVLTYEARSIFFFNLKRRYLMRNFYSFEKRPPINPVINVN